MTKPCDYSIGRRLSVLLALQTIIGLSVLLAFIYGATSMMFKMKHEEQLTQYATLMADIVRDTHAEGGRQAVLEKLAWTEERRPGTFFVLEDAQGTVLYRDQSPDFDVEADTARPRVFQIDVAGEAAPLSARVVLDCAEDAAFGRQMAWLIAAAVLTGGLLAGWGSFWRVRCELKPLLKLAEQTEAIDVRQPGQRLHLPEPAQELRPLIDQFNGLMQRVESTYAQLEGFNADVAHELRTPLATLMGQTEVALSRERSADELATVLESNLEELQRIAAIVNDMLFLAQADRGTKARRGAPVSLAQVVAQVVDFHEAPLEDARLTVAVQGDATVAVDEPLVKRALSNLLGNAIRYAEPGSVLKVSIEAGPQGAVGLVVENRGPSIAPEHLSRLFDRFFRADSARSDADMPHHGLGLSIVAAIARMHDGDTVAMSSAGTTRVGFSMAAPT